MNSIPYIIQGNNIIVMVDNKSHTINAETHINYNKILDAIKTGNWGVVKDLVDVTESMTNYANGKLSIENGNIFWDGRPFHNALAKRILQMYEQGFDVEPMTNFMTNVMENPSFRAVEELYGFMEQNELPLTPDGCFLAYKRVKRAEYDNEEYGVKADDLVDTYTGKNRNNIDDTVTMNRNDLVDTYTGKNRNNIDDTVTMNRNEVDDNPNNTCSKGLHFCSLSYLGESGYGGHNSPIMIVKINPKDVVSIPTDYNNQKGRCCAYTVLSHHGNDDRVEAFNEPVENAEECYDDGLESDNGIHDEHDNDCNTGSVFSKPGS